MRLIYIIATACILLAVAGLGAQNNQLLLMQKHTQPSGGNLLLDNVTNASSAFSLRKLSSSYSGFAIEVRRTSDNTTQDIGFDVNGDLDESALTTFCASTDCHVTTWYDQSGNSLDAAQTTSTKQPKIVSSGVVETENLKPTILFDGSDDELEVGTVSSFNYLHDGTSSSVITVAKYAGSGNIALFGNNKGGAFVVGFSLFYTPLNRIENYITKGSVDYTLNQSPQTTDILSQHLVFMAIDSDNSTASNRSVISINNQADFSTNTNLALPSTNDAARVLTLGNAGVTGSSNFGGNIQEIIFYNTDKTSSKADIKSNINTYYSIY